MDSLTAQKRSWNMSRIKGKNTRPELKVRSLLHKMGYRFRLHKSNDLPGKPDIILPKYQSVIFVNGCFWHRHQGCRLAYIPKSRIEFWEKKFNNTLERDRVVRKQLQEMGWQYITVWECELHDISRLEKILKEKLPRNCAS